MKLLFGLLFTGCAYAQVSTDSVQIDSAPARPLNLMPTVRLRTDFYRHPTDPPRVVRATLDNMPVKGPDSTAHYSMQQVPGYAPKVRPKK